ncbi:MAG TPA: Ig-like domain repeat protein, partial [Bacteroidota bacterium]
MNTCRRFCGSLFVLTVLAAIFTSAAFPQATLTSNKSDYAPGDTAALTGSGFSAGESVQLLVGHADGTFDNDTSTAHQPWQVTSDENGSFETTWIVPPDQDEAGAFLKATADGQTSGLHAELFFTDNVSVTNGSGGAPGAGGTNLSADLAANGAAQAYTTLGNIVITEQSNGDFANSSGASRTLILTAPSGWRFNAGVGNVAAANSKDIVNGSESIVIGSTTLTVTFAVNGTSKTDVLTISGIQVQATDGGAIPSSGSIYRDTTNRGTESIAGILSTSNTSGSGGTNFGSLSQAVGARRLYTVLPAQTFTDAATLPGSGITGTPTNQTAGVSFNLTSLVVADREFNIDNSYGSASPKTISYSGPGGTPTYTTSVTFPAGSGVSTTTLATTLRKAETTAITATDGTVTGLASSNFTVNSNTVTKLQILLPGETAAPGTTTGPTPGKTGTPTTQTAGTAISSGIIVNAVDDNWNRVNSSNPDVTITSSDAGAVISDDNGATAGNITLSGGTDTLASFNFQTPGTQTVTSTDAAATLSANTSANITVNKAASATTAGSSVNPSVFGQLVTFSTTVSGTIGTPTGTVTYKDGGTTIATKSLNGSGQATFDTSGLVAGSHSITVTYNGDSKYLASISSAVNQNVNNANTTTGLTSSLNPSCSGQSVTFTATVTPVAPGGGTPDGNVDFKDGTTVIGNNIGLSGGQATFTTSALSAAAHSMTAVYKPLAQSSFNASTSTVVTQTVNATPSASITAASNVCANAIGNVASVPDAGVGATYSWSITGGTITAGSGTNSITYTAGSVSPVTIKDTVSNTSGCTASSSLTATVNPNPTANAGTDKTICSGGSTAIGGSPTATGGTSPYTYSWSPATNLSSSTVANPTSSTTITRTYTVTVTDSKGCTSSSSMTVNVNPSPTVSVNSAEVCSGNSATLTATPSGGTGAVTYAWSTGATTSTISRSTAGTYSVTVTDTKGCTGSGSGTLTVDPNPTVTVNNPSVCQGSSATLTATPAGGTGSKTFAWSTGATTSTISTGTAGTYSVTVTDTKGCTGSGSGTLAVNPLPTANAGLNQTICNGSPTTIGGSPTASAGTAPYSYGWSPTTGLTGPTTANPTASPIATTTYTVTVTDSKGCTATSSMTLTVNARPTASAGTNQTICNGASTPIGGSPTATLGSSPYTYSWSPTTGLSSATVANPTASPTTTTQYTVTVTDANGCTGTASTTITVNQPPSISGQPGSKAVCEGTSTTFSVTASGTTLTYQWRKNGLPLTNGGDYSGVLTATLSINPVALTDSGTYDVVVSGVCPPSQTSNPAILTVNPSPDVTITAPSAGCTGSTGNTASVPNAGIGATYNWSLNSGTITGGQGTPSITYTAPGNGSSFTISVTVTNSFGCSKIGNLPVSLSTGGASVVGWKNTAPVAWQTSTLQATDAVYAEGATIPFQLTLTQPCVDGAWSVTLQYDFQINSTGLHIFDFLSTANATESSENGHDCDPSGCINPPNLFPIPTDPALSYQIPGNFKVYNGAITSAGIYTTALSGGMTSKLLTISGTASPTGDVVIVFGGHLARDNEWGAGKGAADISNGTYKMAFTNYSGGGGGGNVGVKSSGLIDIQTNADLSVTKTGTPNPVLPGNNITYSLVVNNAGPNSAASVSLVDSIPAGTTFVSVTTPAGWAASTPSVGGTGTVTWTKAKMDSTTSATFGLVTKVNSGSTGTIGNTASVSSTAADPNIADNSATATTSINSCTIPSITTNPSDAAVCAGSTASFSASATGNPTPSLQWQVSTNGGSTWTNTGSGTSPLSFTTSSGQNGNKYQAVFTNTCGTTTSNVATLTVNPNPTVSVNSPEVCSSALPATLTATPSGGTGSKTFAWSSGATTSTISTSTAGTYSVTVTDAKGCSGSGSGTLTVNPNPTVSVNSPEVCSSTLPATLTATPSGGTGALTYAWSTGATTSTISTSTAGTYSVTVTDTKGCAGSASGTLTANANPTVSVNSPEVCSSTLPATLAATPAGGTGAATYAWSTGATTSTISTSTAGTYSVTVTDTKGCTGSGSGTLTVNPNPTVSVNSPEVCSSTLPALLAATPAGGTGAATYAWSTGATTSTISTSTAGTYSVTVTDTKGCTGSGSGTLTVNPNPTVSVNSPEACSSTLPATLTATPAGGTGAATYAWSTGATTSTISTSTAGTYSVTVTDTKGCTGSGSGPLTVNPNPAVSVNSPEVCSSTLPATLTATPAGGTGAATYAWSTGATTSTISTSTAGSYSVTVTDAKGCTGSGSGTLTVNPNPTVSVNSPEVCSSTLPATLTATPSGGTGAATYAWSTGATTSTISTSTAGTYSVTV